MHINKRILTTAFYLLFAFVFCGFFAACSSSSSKPPYDLTKDSNDNGIPDDFEQAYEAAMKIVAGGETDGLDEDELYAFSEALKEIQERLPYSDETEQLLDELAALSAEMMLVTNATDFANLQEQIRQKLELLERDNTYRMVQQSLELLKQQAANTAQKSSASSRTANIAALNAVSSTMDLPKFELLQKGDLMFNRHAKQSTLNLLYVRNYGHAGIYGGNNLVYESGTELGVSFKPLAEWQEDGMTVALARSNTHSQTAVIEAMVWALSEYGSGAGSSKTTPYNYIIPDKYTNAEIYCSQLLWKIFDYLEDDVDSNDPKLIVDLTLQFGLNATGILIDKIGEATALLYPALQDLGNELLPRFVMVSVLPDEVALSKYVTVYNVGRNKTIVAPSTLVNDYVIKPGITIPFTSSGASLNGVTEGIEYRFSLSWSDQKKIFWRPSGSSFWTTNTWRGLTIPHAAAGGWIKIRVDVRDANNVQNTDKAEFTFEVPAAS